MFSHRIPASLAPNRLTRAREEARAEGIDLIDLTQSNPTTAGLDYPVRMLGPLAEPRALLYAPDPLGSRDARSAVAADYRRRGVAIGPERVVLASSTSEAYSLLFKVLCDPEDEVLFPRPSYPLFEHLARLDGIRAVPYDLEYHGVWSIDASNVERVATPRSRVLLIVTPNNPTGSYLKPGEFERLARLCAARGMAIVADEVFADYELVPGAAEKGARPLEETSVLTFSLGGLSKTIGLPQAKLAWIGVGGPAADANAALQSLEWACDTYLSVSTPVQMAAADLLSAGSAVRRQIQSRIAANYRCLTEHFTGTSSCSVLHAEGGWYAVVQVPTLGSEEDLVVDLLTTDGVLVHPGYFFDFPRESYLVLSLIPSEREFLEGITRVLRRFDRVRASSLP